MCVTAIFSLSYDLFPSVINCSLVYFTVSAFFLFFPRSCAGLSYWVRNLFGFVPLNLNYTIILTYWPHVLYRVYSTSLLTKHVPKWYLPKFFATEDLPPPEVSGIITPHFGRVKTVFILIVFHTCVYHLLLNSI